MALASILVFIGSVFLFLVIWLVDRHFGERIEPIEPDETWGRFESDKEWDKLAAKAQTDALASVRSSATAWAASITGLLGLGASVTVVAGPGAISDLTGDGADLVFAFTIVGAVWAGLSVYLATLASQGSPKIIDGGDADGALFKKAYTDRIKRGIWFLGKSRMMAVTAGVLVFIGFAVAWADSASKVNEEKNMAIVADIEEALHCGKVETTEDGLLTLVGGPAETPLKLKTIVEEVKSCPDGK